MKNYLIKAESLKSELCLITEMNKVSPSSTSKSRRINGNNSKDNLPDPITPVKCYRVCQQQQQQLQQPKKTSSPDLKTDIKRKSPAELKAISPSSMYYPTASQTNEINYYLREQLTINSISEINDCLSSDKASVITRVKQWFTRQNYKDEKVSFLVLLSAIARFVSHLTNFGFAKCIEGTAHMNEVRGTLLYMAPEIYCEGVYHPSCDLWSVGIILYGELNGCFSFLTLFI
ncbi:unnamed protein product [Trichobilharzia regenti]|nr:unnamed protein product [Trichobilharzia regenti]